MSSQEMLLQLVGMVFTAGATWGALRADIRALIERVRSAEDQARGAHARLDALLLKGQ